MVAYSFKKRFTPEILAGRKLHTIRADRKRHARPGEEVQLYEAMRTKACKLIGRATCRDVDPIRIDFAEDRVEIGEIIGRSVETRADLDEFAKADGFRSWDDMTAFWAKEHAEAFARGAWSGVIIFWKDLRS